MQLAFMPELRQDEAVEQVVQPCPVHLFAVSAVIFQCHEPCCPEVILEGFRFEIAPTYTRQCDTALLELCRIFLSVQHTVAKPTTRSPYVKGEAIDTGVKWGATIEGERMVYSFASKEQGNDIFRGAVRRAKDCDFQRDFYEKL